MQELANKLKHSMGFKLTCIGMYSPFFRIDLLLQAPSPLFILAEGGQVGASHKCEAIIQSWITVRSITPCRSCRFQVLDCFQVLIIGLASGIVRSVRWAPEKSFYSDHDHN